MPTDLTRLLLDTAVDPLERIDVGVVAARALRRRRSERLAASIAVAAVALAIAIGVSLVTTQIPDAPPILDVPRPEAPESEFTDTDRDIEAIAPDDLPGATPAIVSLGAPGVGPASGANAPDARVAAGPEDEAASTSAAAGRSETHAWSFDSRRTPSWDNVGRTWRSVPTPAGSGLGAYRSSEEPRESLASPATDAAAEDEQQLRVATASPDLPIPAWARHVEVEIAYRWSAHVDTAWVTLGCSGRFCGGSRGGDVGVWMGTGSRTLSPVKMGEWRRIVHRFSVDDIVAVDARGVPHIEVTVNVEYPRSAADDGPCRDRSPGGPCDLGFAIDDVTLRFLAE